MRSRCTRVVRAALVVVLVAAVLVPGVAFAAGGFTDTAGSVFRADIDWLAGAGVTRGCNPPANTLFCPDDGVTRGQMAAFMRRFAQFLGAEDGVVSRADHAGTAVTAATAGHASSAADAGTLDGKDSSAFVEHGGVVVAHDGTAWMGWGGLTLDLTRAGTHTLLWGPGTLVIALDAPTLVGGVEYGLDEVELCYETIGDSAITEIFLFTSTGAGEERLRALEVDLSGTRCEAIPVGAAAPRGASLGVTVSDPNTPSRTVLYSVLSTWSTAAAQP